MEGKEIVRILSATLDELRQISDRDPEQEIQGRAVSVLDAVISEAKKLLPDHAILTAFEELISPGAIERAEAAPRVVDVRAALAPVLAAVEASVPNASIHSAARQRLDDFSGTRRRI